MKIKAFTEQIVDKSDITHEIICCGLCGASVIGKHCSECSTENILPVNDYSREERHKMEMEFEEIQGEAKEKINQILIQCNKCHEDHYIKKGDAYPSSCVECDDMYAGFTEVKS